MKKAILNIKTGYIENVIEIAENSAYKPPADCEIIEIPQGVNIEIGGNYDQHSGVFTAKEPTPAPIVYDMAAIAADIDKLKADVTALKSSEVIK